MGHVVEYCQDKVWKNVNPSKTATATVVTMLRLSKHKYNITMCSGWSHKEALLGHDKTPVLPHVHRISWYRGAGALDR